ncbi:glyoxalase [Halobacteriales archaeon SW_7_68_16]|nr:MAG: glyoxalase [Halobacteriales archaeon SW_7_68_16]
MYGTLDHTMVRVADLDESLSWYEDHLGYEEHGRVEADEYTLVYLGPPDAGPEEATVELTYNHDGRTYELGDAWGHLAVRVRDVYDAYDELLTGGVEDYRDPDSCGGNYAFVRDPDGHEIELVERDGGARYGLDHTMIRVESADRAIGWYVRKLGYELHRRAEYDDFSLYFLAPPDAGPGAMSIELTENHDDSTYDVGDAWGHLAVRVDDLDAAWDRLRTRRAADYRDPASCGGQYAFTKDADGHEIELLPG